MEQETQISTIFNLMEQTARSGRELVTKIFNAEKEEHKNNINFTQYQILDTIAAKPNITTNEICINLFKNQVYVSKCLKFFESKKYITRSFINCKDKVTTGYTITERGQIPYKTGIMTLNHLERKIISKLNSSDVENTTLYLTNLQTIIKEINNTIILAPPKIDDDGEEE